MVRLTALFQPAAFLTTEGWTPSLGGHQEKHWDKTPTHTSLFFWNKQPRPNTCPGHARAATPGMWTSALSHPLVRPWWWGGGGWMAPCFWGCDSRSPVGFLLRNLARTGSRDEGQVSSWFSFFHRRMPIFARGLSRTAQSCSGPGDPSIPTELWCRPSVRHSPRLRLPNPSRQTRVSRWPESQPRIFPPLSTP